MYYHFSFIDGSNPYISMTSDDFMRMFRKYDINTIKPGFYLVFGVNADRSYKCMKERAEALAVAYQSTLDLVTMSCQELTVMQELFEMLGRRYGLLSEFHANGIC